MKRNGARVSPCNIPAHMSNGNVSPSGLSTVAGVSVYKILIASMISDGISYKDRILNIISLSTESKALLKSIKTRATSQLQYFLNYATESKDLAKS